MEPELGEPCKGKLWGLNGGHSGSPGLASLGRKNSLRAGSEVGKQRAWGRRQGKGSLQGWRVRTREMGSKPEPKGVPRGMGLMLGRGCRGPAVVAVLEAQAAGWAWNLEPMISLGVRDLGFQTICFIQRLSADQEPGGSNPILSGSGTSGLKCTLLLGR